MKGLTEAKAALERGKSVVLVCAPAPEQAAAVWELLPQATPGRRPGVNPPVNPPVPTAVIVAPDQGAAGEWVAAAPAGRRVHAVTGLGRAGRLLKAGAVDVLAGATPDLAALVGRSTLKLDAVTIVVIAWPESAPADHTSQLDALLGEARTAGRLILTWNPALIGDLLERHAHRGPVIGALPVGEDGRPLPPLSRARYAVVAPGQRLGALSDALDVLDPPRAFVWTPDPRHADRITALLGTAAGVVAGITPPVQPEPFDAVICARLPTREQLASLARLAPSPVVVLAAPYQLPYLRSLASPLEPLPRPTAADRAQTRVEALRARIAEVLEGEGVGLDAELSVLAPLFERFDPAEVAAALLAISRQPSAVSPGAANAPAPAWVKVFVNIGKKDRAAAKDLVGALIKEVGVAKAQIGRIEVRETFSIVEVAADAAASAVQRLTGVTIKGRRAQARLDRQAPGSQERRAARQGGP